MSEQDLERQISFFSSSPEKMKRLIEMARELGGFAITQLRPMDAEFVQLSEDERARQERLDTDIKHYERGTELKTSQLGSRLAAGGVQTVRDLLVLGEHRLYRRGKLQFNLDRMADIAEVLRTHFPDETWHKRPTASHIATICTDLHQVHAGVLPTYDRYIEQGELRDLKAMLRVGAILDDRFDWGDLGPSAVLPPDVLETCREEAAVFAYEFGEARRTLAERPQGDE